MKLLLAASASLFTIYPGSNNPSPRIEAITDRGPLLEMIVRCPRGTAIMTYSKIEHLYCSPKHACFRSQSQTIADACR